MNFPTQGFPQQGFPQQGYPQQQQQGYPQQQQQVIPAQPQQQFAGQQQFAAPTPLQQIQLPSIFQNVDLGSELSDNVSGGFAVVSIKGKVFRIKSGGVETPLTANFQGTAVAAPFFDVIIPRASDKLAKTYYEGGYTEGSDESPRCASEDGIAPNTPNPISPQCATCPMNAFGSKINEATGKRGKACADTRKLVVVPANNVDNEQFGGAMLLRVPAASLGSLADYDKQLRGMGIPYYAVVTRISFDQTVAYPRLVFTPVAGIDEPTAAKVLAMRADPVVHDILFGTPVVTAPAIAAPHTQPQAMGAPLPQQYAPQVPQQTQQQFVPQQVMGAPYGQQAQPQQQFHPQQGVYQQVAEQAFPGAVPGYPGGIPQQPPTQFAGQQQAFQQQPQTVPGFDPMQVGGMQQGFQPAPPEQPAPAPEKAPRRRRAAAAPSVQPQQQEPQQAPQQAPQQQFQQAPQQQFQQAPQMTGFAPPPPQGQGQGGLLNKLDALLGTPAG